jgi:hypothetical protein
MWKSTKPKESVADKKQETDTMSKDTFPEREAWLYDNKEALGAVRRGLEQARSRTFAKRAPDLGAAKALADQLLDD